VCESERERKETKAEWSLEREGERELLKERTKEMERHGKKMLEREREGGNVCG